MPIYFIIGHAMHRLRDEFSKLYKEAVIEDIDVVCELGLEEGSVIRYLR